MFWLNSKVIVKETFEIKKKYQLNFFFFYFRITQILSAWQEKDVGSLS